MNIPVADYYMRQATIPEVGVDGIARLQRSKVAVIGAGGVGSALAFYLSRSGVGYIRLIDQDIVLESNLQRVHGATLADVYHPKAEVLAHRLSSDLPSCKIDPIVETLTRENSADLLDGVDLLVDGVDNFRTRYELNEFSIHHEIPFLFTSSVGQQVHVSMFSPPSTGCLACVLPNVKDRSEESCESIGVASTTTGFTGALGASVVVRYLLGLSTDLVGHLLTIDLTGPDFILTKTVRNESCRSCGLGPAKQSDTSTIVSMLCGHETANVLPPQSMSLDLLSYSRNLAGKNLLGLSESAIVYKDHDRLVSLFRNGRVLVEGVSSEDEALKVAEQVWAQSRGGSL